MTDIKIVPFPNAPMDDVPTMLCTLAEEIREGKYGDSHCLAWVLDLGGHKVAVGLCGQSALPGAEAHLLLHMGLLELARGPNRGE